jgi:hypothetical protein
MQRAPLLRQLVLDAQYAIDEHLVADAILARAAARRLIGDAAFRNDVRAPAAAAAVRSFRPSTQVRSFRPCALRSPHDRRRMALHVGLL